MFSLPIYFRRIRLYRFIFNLINLKVLNKLFYISIIAIRVKVAELITNNSFAMLNKVNKVSIGSFDVFIIDNVDLGY